MELTLYLDNGKLATFKNVTDLKKEEKFYNIITFNYVSMSDNKKKRVFFRTNDLSGLSVDKEDFDVNSLF